MRLNESQGAGNVCVLPCVCTECYGAYFRLGWEIRCWYTLYCTNAHSYIRWFEWSGFGTARVLAHFVDGELI
jgi:hypothetical protein